MKKNFALFVVLCFVGIGWIQAQHISYGEYYFNSDPGFGNGTPLSFAPDSTVQLSFTASGSSLQQGLNFVFVRFRTGEGLWSHTINYPVLIRTTPDTTASVITAGEMYFDKDPGFGNGSPLSFTPGSPVQLALTVPIDQLNPGRHHLYLRFRNAGGAWSHTAPLVMRVRQEPILNKITGIEYAFDEDSNFANFPPINIPKLDLVDSTLLAETTGLPLGEYTLLIRAVDEQGRTSHMYHLPVKVCTTYGPQADFEIEINRGKAYITDLSEYTTDYTWIYGDGEIDTLVQNPSHTYVPGHYDLCFIAANECGIDTFCQSIIVRGISNVTPSVHANEGFMAMDIYGGGLETQSEVYLYDTGGVSIQAEKVTYVDDTWLRAVFRFRGEPTGNYHVEVAGNSGTRDTFHNAFELQPATPPVIWSSLNGRHEILPNRNWSYSLSVGNNGTTTAFGVPVYISATKDFKINLKETFSTDSIPQAILDSSSHFNTYFDSLSNDSVTFGAFVIPYISPGETRTIDFDLRAPSVGWRHFSYRTAAPLVEEWQIDSIYRSSCKFLPPCLQCITDLLGFVPALGCGIGIMNLGCSIGNNFSNPNTDNLLDLVGNIGGTFLSCTVVINAGAALDNAISAAGAAGGANSAIQSCAPGNCLPDPPGDDDVNVVSSFDPNIKVGPIGAGTEHYIRGFSPAAYTVYFENDPTASAPAQVVHVVDTLNVANYAFANFRWREFGFGDTVFTIREQGFSYVTEIDLSPEKNLIVRFEGDLDTTTGVLSSTFTSLEGDTLKIPDDPQTGFLPPNVQYPEGMGFVRFSLPLRKDLNHLDEIENKATIIFDANAPIQTPVWNNIIDRQAPQSEVTALPATVENTVLEVTWGGIDPHSGISSYVVYVSENDSAYDPWIKTSATSAYFKGKYGSEYKFYTVATDRVGNEELPPSDPHINPDAVVSLIKPSGLDYRDEIVTDAYIRPNPANSSASLVMDVSQAGNYTYKIVSMSGLTLGNAELGRLSGGQHSIELNISNLPAGIYAVELNRDSGKIHYLRLIIAR